MLIKDTLKKPKIDIAYYVSSPNIPPIIQVKSMEPKAFEQFTLEWLYASRSELYNSIVNIGGSGDKGRDVIGYYENGQSDYYQCKHYSSPLAPTDYYLELGKLLYYTYMHEYDIPINYYIVASNDIGPKLNSLIENPDQLKQELKSQWDKYCKSEIIKGETIELESEFKSYVDDFNLNIIKHCPIQMIINEHIETIYGSIRFGGLSAKLPDTITPPEEIDKDNELKYVTELLKAYADAIGVKDIPLGMLENYKKYYHNFQRQRKDYYSAETIRRFVRDTFTDSDQFDTLKTEIYDGVVEVYESEYINGFERLTNVMKQASAVSVDKCLLSSKMNCIGNSEKKGTCHMLVNDEKMKWIEYDEKSF